MGGTSARFSFASRAAASQRSVSFRNSSSRAWCDDDRGSPSNTRSYSACKAGTSPNPSGGVHDCTTVPPHVASISPTGTPNFWCNSRPKRNPTAENPFQPPSTIVCGVQTFHAAGSMSARGSGVHLFGTMSSRMRG